MSSLKGGIRLVFNYIFWEGMFTFRQIKLNVPTGLWCVLQMEEVMCLLSIGCDARFQAQLSIYHGWWCTFPRRQWDRTDGDVMWSVSKSRLTTFDSSMTPWSIAIMLSLKKRKQINSSMGTWNLLRRDTTRVVLSIYMMPSSLAYRLQ